MARVWADQPLRLHVFLLLLEGQQHRYVHRAALGGAVRVGSPGMDDWRGDAGKMPEKSAPVPITRGVSTCKKWCG